MAKPKGRSWREAYAKSDWATKTNERSVAKQMPLLSEFAGYSAWGDGAKIWTMMLYNRPVSSAIDCFIINLKDSSDTIDKEASGHLDHKLKTKVEDNEKDMQNGVEFGPIEYEWLFGVFKARYQEPAGAPVTRITKQLSELETVIYSELGVRVRNPEGVWAG